MTLLEPEAVTYVHRQLANHQRIIADNAKDARPQGEIVRAYTAAVADLKSVLDHLRALESDLTTEVTYGGLSYVHQREHWHDNPQDEGAFDDMTAAYTHLRDAVAAYNMGAFEDAAQ